MNNKIYVGIGLSIASIGSYLMYKIYKSLKRKIKQENNILNPMFEIDTIKLVGDIGNLTIYNDECKFTSDNIENKRVSIIYSNKDIYCKIENNELVIYGNNINKSIKLYNNWIITNVINTNVINMYCNGSFIDNRN